MNGARWRAVLAALAVLVGLGITVELTSNDDGNGHKSHGITVRIDGPDADTKHDDKLVLGAKGEQVLKAAEAAPEKFDLGDNLRGPDKEPAGVLTGPLASQEWPGCKTAFVRAFSARTSTVRAIALHYTAGANVTGWGDVDGLTAFSNNVSNGVSWHFGIDREGHCSYNVPTRYKAWTISSLNSQTVNIEGVGRGNEPDYLDGAGFTKLSSVVRRIARIYGIPIRLGATDGHCNVTRTGIITHWMGGSCSGGHIDIRPYSIENVVRRIAADAGASTAKSKPVAHSATVWCRKLSWYRVRARGHHSTTPAMRSAARTRKALLVKHHYSCQTSKRGKATVRRL